MKRVIFALGLGTLLTMSNLLASDLTTSEPLAGEPLTAENLFKGFYIKPFAGGWGISLIDKVGYRRVYVPQIEDIDEEEDGDYYFFCQIQSELNSTGGIAVGKHLNEYISMESSIGYCYSDDFKFLYVYDILRKHKIFGRVAYTAETKYLGIINAILSPIINVNIIEYASLYFTAGIGASYIMFSNDAKDWTVKTKGYILQQRHIEYANSETLSPSEEVGHYNNAQKLHLSWGAGVGIRIRLTESMEFDMGYSYKSLGKLPTCSVYQEAANDYGASVVESIPLLVHEIRTGLKFNF